MTQYPPSCCFFFRNGLRNCATCLVNVTAAWGNIVVYFELPPWLTDLDNVVESDDDPDDVKALKRFVNGDDAYRNKRLKLMASIVDAPYVVKMVVPQKKGVPISNPLVPVAWRKHPSTTTSTGNNTNNPNPMMEVELDIMSNKAMRGAANIVKNNLKSITIDLAAIIEKPHGQKEEEPSAVLGMWRFDQLDISTCPHLPVRVTTESEQYRRASVIMMQTLPEEEEEVEAEESLQTQQQPIAQHA